MSNVVKFLNAFEFLYSEDPLFSTIKRTVEYYPESEGRLAESLSMGQLKSKLWLIEHLPDNLGTVFVCAGWYGTLAHLMFKMCRNKFETIRSFDIDDSCADIADTINRPWVMDGWQFKASTLDIQNLEYPTRFITSRANGTCVELTEDPSTIINTSCEHIENFDKWYSNIPSGKIVVLQTNNYFDIDEHINCVNTLKEFAEQTPLSTLLYEGELTLQKYTRFMRIGIK